MNGIQKLRGGNVKIINPQIDPIIPNTPVDPSPPNEIPPTETAGNPFNYDVRSADFAAVNAYYNVDRIIELIRDLTGNTFSNQFPNTAFPLPLDHRGWGGLVNANAMGGPNNNSCIGIIFGSISYQSPFIGIATAYRVALHEFGHALLFDHAGSGKFEFAHSYGDSLAAILNDPNSQASDKFDTFPWVNSAGIKYPRRHDRDIAQGWAWGGAKDNGAAGYDSEQILSTSLFRAYRSIGGDSEALSKRELSSRLMVLLMLKAVRDIEPESNPNNAEDFVDLMTEADSYTNQPYSVDGVSLGVAHKAIRWAFEKQGAYQEQPTGNQEGLPPEVDVYIDDGRNGEYPFIYYSWHTTDIKNRQQADGVFEHQIPILDTSNYVYVKIKNRGLTTANNILVKGYHCPPGGGGAWPQGWTAMETAEINLTEGLEPGESTIAGPLEWIPVIEGHECLMMSVSATGDEANTGSIDINSPNWLIINNDNNLAQRNVAPAPAEEGSRHLAEAFKVYQLYVRNPYLKPISVEMIAKLPPLLKKKNWKLKFVDVNPNVKLKAGDQIGKQVKMNLIPGEPFSRQDVLKSKNKDIEIILKSSEGIIGGMTYRLDPDLKEYNERKKTS